MSDLDTTAFTAESVANKAASTHAFAVARGVKYISVYSLVAAHVHATGVTAATGGIFIKADSWVTGIPVSAMGGGGQSSNFTITAVTGNLSQLSIVRES